MLIRSIRVCNFRCIEDESLILADYTVLVGRNGCGKSSFLEALQFFGQPNYKLDRDDFWNGDVEREISVQITFGDLSDEELNEFSKYVRDGALRVEKVAIWDADNEAIGPATYHGQRLKHEPFDHIRELRGRNLLTAYSNQRQVDGYTGLPAVRSEADAREALETWEGEHEAECEIGRDDGRFFGFTNVGIGKLDKYARFIRIPAIMDALSLCDEGGSPTLKFLVDSLVRRAGAADVIQQLRDRTADEYSEVLQRPEFDLQAVETELTACIQEFVPHSSAVVSWGTAGSIKIPDPTAIVALNEAGFVGSPAKKGHGLLRAFEMAVLALLSERVTQETAEEEEPQAGSLLIGIDEPELYQHPAQARVIVDRLRRLAGSVVGDYRLSVVCTSHSPLFVTLDSCESVRVVRRGEVGRVRGPARVWAADLERMATRLGKLEGADGFTGETLRPRMAFLFQPTITEAVFADFVVLVEGDEDAAILESSFAFRNNLERFRRLGMFVVPVGGKTNLDRMILLLREFGIPNYVVFDGDYHKDEDPGALNAKIVTLASDGKVTDPGEDTDVQEDYAIMSKTLAIEIRESVGADVFNQVRDVAAAEFGYRKPSAATKSPVVVRRMLELIARDHTYPPVLDELLAAIAAKARLELER